MLGAPAHPYTRQLIAAVPPLDIFTRDAGGKPVSTFPHPARPPPRPIADTDVMTVTHVSKTFRSGGLFGRGARTVRALDDISLSLPCGATLGIVGESGSGKSTLARCIVRLLDPDSGEIRIAAKDGREIDLAKLSRRAMRKEAPRVQMVFQDPFASLNPRRKAIDLVSQGPIAHGMRREEALRRARELFELVGLDPESAGRYPHEFSGGQRQRIGLARALALSPEVLVADEPVSALDVSVQAQVLRLLADLRERLGLSMLFITHDLRVAAQICDRVVVMKDGAIVEAGAAAAVFGAPQHDYTRALLASIPGRDLHRNKA